MEEWESFKLGTIDEALTALRRGELVVVADDENRENEGDLIMVAELATPKAIAFMVRHTTGLICVGMTPERLDELELPLMVPAGHDSMGTAFTVSVDWAPGTATGISAGDRAATVQALCNSSVLPADLARPGHVFPLRARPGGVLKRAGHTEAAVDLARMAGFQAAGVLSEIVNDDGTMARRDDLARFAERHGLVMITTEDLIAHRRRHECLVRRVASASVATEHGLAVIHAYESKLDGVEHVAVVYGDFLASPPPLVRVHSECLTGDVLGSARCDCGPQLQAAQRLIAQEGTGVVIYLRGHEGQGIGLAHKLQAYNLQDEGLDTLDANLALGLPVDSREHGIGAQILADLGVRQLRLLTNNAEKYRGLTGHGLEIVARIPLRTSVTPGNHRYLEAKQRRMGHDLVPGSA